MATMAPATTTLPHARTSRQRWVVPMMVTIGPLVLLDFTGIGIAGALSLRSGSKEE